MRNSTDEICIGFEGVIYCHDDRKAEAEVVVECSSHMIINCS